MTPHSPLPLLATLALLGAAPAFAQAPAPAPTPSPAPAPAPAAAPEQPGQPPAGQGDQSPQAPSGQSGTGEPQGGQPQGPHTRDSRTQGPETEGPGGRVNPAASVAPGDLTPERSVPLPGNATRSLDGGRWRASRLLGADIASSENNVLGKVEDLIFTPEGGLTVVIGTGGFLGMGERLVAVPFSRLQHSERWVLPGATEETLRQMPEFRHD